MPKASVEIQGHTDSVGSAAANEKLSLARAESVREHLVKEEKIESHPIASNDTAEGREKNRRWRSW
jgi:OOP family OmpA-OmpF porin